MKLTQEGLRVMGATSCPVCKAEIGKLCMYAPHPEVRTNLPWHPESHWHHGVHAARTTEAGIRDYDGFCRMPETPLNGDEPEVAQMVAELLRTGA